MSNRDNLAVAVPSSWQTIFRAIVYVQTSIYMTPKLRWLTTTIHPT